MPNLSIRTISMIRLLKLSIIFLVFLTSCSTIPTYNESLKDSLISENYDPVVRPWEDGLRTDPEGKSFEWWYFDASFSDGSTAVIFFSTKSIFNPAGKADPGVTIVITDPYGNTTEASDNPGRDNFSAGTDNLDVKIGNSFFIGDLNKTRIYFEKDGIVADLTLVSEAPPWRPGSGISYYDTKKEKYFAWLPAIPYGTVAGTLRYNGETIAVEGTGYHDHNWGNIRLDKIKTQWYWGRAKIGEYTLIFSQMLTSPKYGGTLIPVFYLAKDDIIISDLKFEYEFTASGWRQHPGGRDYPTKIRIVFYQDNLETAITISNPEFIEEKYLLEDAPWFVKVLSKPFTNPYYFRFKSDFELNIKDHGEQINKTGSGIFEMMLLRGLQTVR